jgi:hypothetical protein
MTITIDEVFKDQAGKLKAMGLSDNAVDKALLFMAIEFLNELIKQQAEMKIRLDTLDQLKADLQAVKDLIAALTAE